MANPPIRRRSLSEQVAYRFGFASNLYLGAEQTSQCGKGRIEIYGLPTFLLLGFALENAFAAYLIACDHKKPGDYKSHDLAKAMTPASCTNWCLRKTTLSLSKGLRRFIKALRLDIRNKWTKRTSGTSRTLYGEPEALSPMSKLY
jgi:hypothetical protein